jgi:tripartite-type tricarboxylate transporter receptor subunit TctC
MRIVSVLLAGLAAIALSFQQAAANDYPTRTVRVIEPYSAGGAPDLLLRLVAQKLSEKWGQSVVVENRPGGNTFIGTLAVTKSAPDGYTLLLTGDQTYILNPLLYSNMPYSVKELDPVVLMAAIPHMLAVANKVPVSSVKELVALAKSSPGKLTYGTTGPGSIQRLATEYFASIVGVKLLHVPYRGAPETTTALLAGQIDMTINGMSNLWPHMKSGKLKVLAISTPKRNALVPDLPTMQEAGVPGYASKGSFALFAPAGTPAAIKDKIAKDISEILMRPDVRESLAKLSFVVENADSSELEKMIQSETVKWGDVIKRLNVKLD